MLIPLSSTTKNLSRSLSILAFNRASAHNLFKRLFSLILNLKPFGEGIFALRIYPRFIFLVPVNMNELKTSDRLKSDYFDLDEVLESEIKFGKYQIFQFLLIAFPIFLNGIFTSTYIFTAGTVNYRYVIH